MTLSGGLGDHLSRGLKRDGLIGRFLEVTEREYTLAFGHTLAGENLPFGLPTAQIQTATLGDFTACSSQAKR